MKNRTELAKHFAELGFTRGAEIGVYLGYYSRVLLDNIPGLTLYSIDSWDRNKTRERAFQVALETLGQYNGANLIKGESVPVAETFEDESLDFVFIDADHSYNAVKKDLEAWYPKVRVGGIVSGHDYFESPRKTVQVIPAVDEFVAKHNLDLQITEWDKENPHADDRQPCFYFIKK